MAPETIFGLTSAVDGPLENTAGLSIAETCDQALRRAGQPLTVHQLLDVVETSGKDMSGNEMLVGSYTPRSAETLRDFAASDLDYSISEAPEYRRPADRRILLHAI